MKEQDPASEKEECTEVSVSRPDTSLLLSSSKPMNSREETKSMLQELLHGPRPQRCNVYGSGPLLVSDVPSDAKRVNLGIDEAGRGPVLGPMTYGLAYWGVDETELPSGLNDSKQLTAERRTALFDEIIEHSRIGYVLRVLHASEISRNMLRREPYNLNLMSHDAAIQMIQAVLDAGLTVDTCYIDTVGIADSYRSKLQRVFEGHNITFVVEKKADAKYAECSAASIVAKVSRDSMLESWVFSEKGFEPIDGKDFGSGYPSDPKCKKWLEKNQVDPVFCFPDLVRLSWGPVKTATKERGVTVDWEASDEEEEDSKNGLQMQLNSFLIGKDDNKTTQTQQTPARKKPRLGYFETKGLNTVCNLLVR